MSMHRITLARPCPLTLGQVPDKLNHQWFCSQCKESVYDLSEMGPERAAELLHERAHAGQETCGEWYADDTGRVLFNVTRAAAAAAAVLLAAPALADGNDIAIPDAVAFLLDEEGAVNREQEDANSSGEPAQTALQQDNASADIPPISAHRGLVILQPTPSVATQKP